jgi:hypothetical protein
MNVARQQVLLLLFVAGSMCVASVPARSDDATNQVRSTAEQVRQQRQKQTFAKGTLTGIDFQRHALRLQTVDGVRIFVYTPQTYIFRGKDKITVDKLKTGETMALRFHIDSDGINVIVRIKAYGLPTDDTTPPAATVPTNQLPNATSSP